MARTIRERADVVPLIAEVFREHGYEGASLTLIGRRTGLGKGSLYHFFPGGKEEMAEAALEHVSTWFEEEIFRPLEAPAEGVVALTRMFDAVTDYFHSGRRACLVGVFALDSSRDLFAVAVSGYFRRWITALQAALERSGVATPQAARLARAVIGDIQGAIVLSRALDDTGIFKAAMERLRTACTSAAGARQIC